MVALEWDARSVLTAPSLVPRPLHQALSMGGLVLCRLLIPGCGGPVLGCCCGVALPGELWALSP